MSIPQQVWEEISLDFVLGLPYTKGYSVIMVVVDRLSRYGHYIPLHSDFTRTSLANSFIYHVSKLHGIPKNIVSDKDKTFTSHFWRQLFQSMGTTLAFSSSYHPQSDSQIEALNKCLEQDLRCCIGDNPRSWPDLLP